MKPKYNRLSYLYRNVTVPAAHVISTKGLAGTQPD